MPNRLTLLALFSFLLLQAGAQPTISGFLRDSVTHYPVVNGTVSNPGRHLKVQTDANGFFRIAVKPNELLYAVASGYRYDTLRYSMLFSDTLTIYLAPTGMLEGVTVRSGYSRYQLDSLERRKNFELAYGRAPQAVSSATSGGFGLSLSLDRFFKKKYRNLKKEEVQYKRNEEIAYVQSRFSPQQVAAATGLKGEELRQFLYRYTPTYTWLRQHPTQEELVYYLSDKLKLFRGSGE